MKDKFGIPEDQSEVLNKISDAIASSAPAGEIARIVLADLALHVECDIYSIYLAAETKSTFAVMPRRPAREEAALQLKNLVSKAIDAFAQEGISFQNVDEFLFEPISSGDGETNLEAGEEVEIRAIKSYLNFPIVAGDKIAGLLSVGSAKGIFGTEDLDVVSGLAHAVGTAIENAAQGTRKE